MTSESISKKCGTCVFLNKNFLLAPINTEGGRCEINQTTPIINKSKGTIQFHYYETHRVARAQIARSQRSYFFGTQFE